MNGTQRITAALKGEKVDRAPIWLREGFGLYEEVPDVNNFSEGWKAEPIYRKLIEDVTPHCDVIKRWFGGAFNRFMEIPSKAIRLNEYMVSDNMKRVEGFIHAPGKTLNFIQESKRGQKTSWMVKEPVECVEDLYALLEIPFEIDRDCIKKDIQKQRELRQKVGEHGVTCLFLDSPIVTISGSMSFENFLEMTITEKEFFHEALKEITRRNLILIDEYFKEASIDTIVTLGGSEQCTPPMMSPRSFDEYVVPYDTPIVKRLKEYGIPVTCHCHGRVKHALPLMPEIGYDATDPVEPPPSGDLTYEEARRLADGKITLIGNLEWSELEFMDTQYIRNRVKEILDLGSDRLIMAASAGPISAINQKLADNYRAWVETAVEYNK